MRVILSQIYGAQLLSIGALKVEILSDVQQSVAAEVQDKILYESHLHTDNDTEMWLLVADGIEDRRMLEIRTQKFFPRSPARHPIYSPALLSRLHKYTSAVTCGRGCSMPKVSGLNTSINNDDFTANLPNYLCSYVVVILHVVYWNVIDFTLDTSVTCVS